MAISAGVGISNERDGYEAGKEACRLARERAGGGVPELTIAFASVSFDQNAVVRGIREASAGTPLIGCTDAGEITNEGPAHNSVAVMAIVTDQIVFTPGVGRDIAAGARAAGAALAREIKEKVAKGAGSGTGALGTAIILPDVLAGNGADIVRGVLDVLGEHFPLIGGAAGDDFLFQKTYQYQDDEVLTGSVVGVGLSGKFTLGVGVRHGWIPIGVPMKVTKSAGSIVYELDHRPAISIYEDYFGEKVADLKREPLARMAITYPLGLKVPGLDEYLIRDPITADAQGAITCAAEIPEGSEIRLMIGSKENAIEAAEEAAKKMMQEFATGGKAPKLLLMFNCIAREKLFAQHAKDEIDAVMKIVGENIPLLGFYTYGEQAPINGETRAVEKIHSRFYNETIVMMAIGE